MTLTPGTIALTERVQAIPVPRPLYADDLWMVGFFACAFILVVVFSDRKRYFAHLLRDFFLPRERTVEGTRTTSVVYMRLGMFFVGLSSMAMLLAIYASERLPIEFERGALWLLSGGMVTLFYLLKLMLLVATNRVFFDSPTIALWEQSYVAWTILSAVPLFVLCGVVLFFNFSSHMILLLLGAEIGLLEICLLYKAFHIFSGKKYGILQIFVYLCTLELMPLLVVGKALVLFV